MPGLQTWGLHDALSALPAAGVTHVSVVVHGAFSKVVPYWLHTNAARLSLAHLLSPGLHAIGRHWASWQTWPASHGCSSKLLPSSLHTPSVAVFLQTLSPTLQAAGRQAPSVQTWPFLHCAASRQATHLPVPGSHSGVGAVQSCLDTQAPVPLSALPLSTTALSAPPLGV